LLRNQKRYKIIKRGLLFENPMFLDSRGNHVKVRLILKEENHVWVVGRHLVKASITEQIRVEKTRQNATMRLRKKIMEIE